MALDDAKAANSASNSGLCPVRATGYPDRSGSDCLRQGNGRIAQTIPAATRYRTPARTHHGPRQARQTAIAISPGKTGPARYARQDSKAASKTRSGFLFVRFVSSGRLPTQASAVGATRSCFGKGSTRLDSALPLRPLPSRDSEGNLHEGGLSAPL
jgi:hypothetical protein